MDGAELWFERASRGESYGYDGVGVAGDGVKSMWGVGVVSESDCGSDGSREEEAGCAVLSSGEWNIDVPIVLKWNVAGGPGCLWCGSPVLEESVWTGEGG